MKKYLLILSVFIPFATTALILYFIINFKNNVKVTGSISDISIKDILNSKLGIVLSLLIDNESNTILTAKNVNVIIYYKGNTIATTKIDDIKINSKESTKINVPVTINIKTNKDVEELLNLYKDKKPIDLEVKIKASLFKFIPVNYNTNFTYTQ